MFDNLLIGFTAITTPMNIFYLFIGCFIGTIVGVLPGVGSSTTIAILISFTYTLPPTTAIAMLAAIYYGAQYGGSISSILVNLPGESSSVVTTIDGYKLTKAGKSGYALFTAAISSLIAGFFGTVLIATFSTQMAELVFKFGPFEYTLLMFLGLVGVALMSTSSIVVAIQVLLFGILLGTVGSDINTGTLRYVFSIPELTDGIGFIVIAVGIYGYGEIINNLSNELHKKNVVIEKINNFYPSLLEFIQTIPATLRGTIIGSLMGFMPGGGVTLSTFLAHAVEKKIKLKHNEIEVGEGNIRGVASPEAANNAAAQSGFIPLLALGIPENQTMALFAGALMIHGIQSGPQLISGNPSLFWGLIISMLFGNLVLIILNIPMVPLWIKLLKISYIKIFPIILLFSTFGVYYVNSNIFDVLLLNLFGIIGYILLKLEIDTTPLLLGFILGPQLEENLKRIILLADGNFMSFLKTKTFIGFFI